MPSSGKSLEEIADMKARVQAGSLHPKLVKEELAMEIVARYHGEEAAAAEAEYNSLPNVKARKLAAIDAETSAAIMAGFECEVTPPDTGTPELLHFSYDEFDQQNFADAAVSMQLASASGGIPTTTPWNAYRNHTADSKGELVILQLTAETFLPIYAAALNHKAAKMAEGGRRKAAVAAAQTVEDVEAI